MAGPGLLVAVVIGVTEPSPNLTLLPVLCSGALSTYRVRLPGVMARLTGSLGIRTDQATERALDRTATTRSPATA